jgi:DNA-binding transcriptional LysR family regulator
MRFHDLVQWKYPVDDRLQSARGEPVEDPAAGRLVRVLPDHSGPSFPKCLVFPPSHRPIPKLRGFIDFVVGEFG